ncbi:FemAB family XrtA/PEP-CTERM system-associated protein [Sphingobium limneticum]|uniref:FemAB family PEP-CTERM system-associated protein n=1 Tax=Sphingobium limneticum TaxID=1007511 RepID=A0A5J5I7A5_9SPHN|nr:FemAB family XrtA/PEP-CTERM system-associated protein [Sphingobium limneticum]KAA9020705.1 FemAB family PEP-CTERM system-associated protein [Sphingobium limneticum]KAA9033031.1 FemAB family PEP-CTERM system-associated protein [Sphingobium limneticum]
MNAITGLGVIIDEARLSDSATVAELDAWVLAHPNSTPFHRPGWVMGVEAGTGQKAKMLVARLFGKDIVGLLPLTSIRSALFGRALVSSGFAVDGGILTTDRKAGTALADAAWIMAERLGCDTLELRGGETPRGASWQEKADAYLGFSRALSADDEAELKAVPKRHRAEIRKGIGNDLTFEMGRDKRLRDIHYRLYAHSVHNLGTPVFPRALFDQVMDRFGDDADIAMVSKDGVPLSAVISLYHRGACMPYWHGAAGGARAMRSNEFLYFSLMRAARERGCTIFDFGRSKVGTGPAAWKKTWGFEGEPLGYHLRTAPGKETRDVNPLSPQYRRKVELWKKLPEPIANLIGPHIARGLG